MDQVHFYGTGRRKEAIARVYLVPGEGKFQINNNDVEKYFGRKILEMLVRQPMELIGAAGRFNVVAFVQGGGVSGQAGALTQGIARALLQAEPEFRIALKRAGFLKRDPRMKERRKYGLKKARRAPQYSKR